MHQAIGIREWLICDIAARLAVMLLSCDLHWAKVQKCLLQFRKELSAA